MQRECSRHASSGSSKTLRAAFLSCLSDGCCTFFSHLHSGNMLENKTLITLWLNLVEPQQNGGGGEQKTRDSQHRVGNLEWETDDSLFALCQPKARNEQTSTPCEALHSAHSFSLCVFFKCQCEQIWHWSNWIWKAQVNSCEHQCI